MAETEAAKDDPGPIGEPAPEEAYGGQWIEVDDCCEAAKDISPRGEAWIKIRGDGRAMTITLVLTHPCGIASYKARVTLWDKTTVSKTSFGKSKNYTLEDTFDCANYELDPGEGGENKSLSKHLDFHWALMVGRFPSIS